MIVPIAFPVPPSVIASVDPPIRPHLFLGAPFLIPNRGSQLPPKRFWNRATSSSLDFLFPVPFHPRPHGWLPSSLPVTLLGRDHLPFFSPLPCFDSPSLAPQRPFGTRPVLRLPYFFCPEMGPWPFCLKFPPCQERSDFTRPLSFPMHFFMGIFLFRILSRFFRAVLALDLRKLDGLFRLPLRRLLST